MSFIRKARDRIPTPKAATIPIAANNSSDIPEIFLISRNVAPRIAGIDRRKENLPASSRFRPQKRPMEMVAPDREIPGMMAIP